MKRSLVIHDIGDHSPAGRARLIEYLANRFELSTEVVGLRLKRLPFVLKNWVDENNAAQVAEELSELGADFELSVDDSCAPTPSHTAAKPSSTAPELPSEELSPPPHAPPSMSRPTEPSSYDNMLSFSFDDAPQEPVKENPIVTPVAADRVTNPSSIPSHHPENPFTFELNDHADEVTDQVPTPPPVKPATSPQPLPLTEAPLIHVSTEFVDLALHPETESPLATDKVDTEEFNDEDLVLKNPELSEPEQLPAQTASPPPPRSLPPPITTLAQNGRSKPEAKDIWPGEVTEPEPVDLSKEPTPLSGAELVRDLLDPTGTPDDAEHVATEETAELDHTHRFGDWTKVSADRRRLYYGAGGFGVVLVGLAGYFLLSSSPNSSSNNLGLTSESIDVLLEQQDDILRVGAKNIGGSGSTTAVIWKGTGNNPDIQSELTIATDLNNIMLHTKQGIVNARLVITGPLPPKLSPEQIVAGVKEQLWLKRFDGRSEKTTVLTADAVGLPEKTTTEQTNTEPSVPPSASTDNDIYRFESIGQGKVYLRQGEKNSRVVGSFRLAGAVDLIAKKIDVAWEIMHKDGEKPADGQDYITQAGPLDFRFYYHGSLTATPEAGGPSDADTETGTTTESPERAKDEAGDKTKDASITHAKSDS